MKNSFPKNFQDIKAANAKLIFLHMMKFKGKTGKKEIHNCEKTKMKFQTLCTDTAEAVH